MFMNVAMGEGERERGFTHLDAYKEISNSSPPINLAFNKLMKESIESTVFPRLGGVERLVIRDLGIGRADNVNM